MSFLTENGDLVKFLKADTQINSLVNGQIFFEQARQKVPTPYVVFTQSAGRALKTHSGRDGCKSLTLHLYCYDVDPNQSQALAELIEAKMLDAEGLVGDATKIVVCNGGIFDTGVQPAIDSSDKKKFWVRLVLSMVIQPV